MHTVVYASITANGWIQQATADHPVEPAILRDFLACVRAHGNVVIGRRTAELMRALGATGALADADVHVVVLSGHDYRLPGADRAASPAQALDLLADRGHGSALIGGGAATDNAFLRAGLVDEIRLNVVPRLTAPGLTLSLGDGGSTNVELIATELLAPGIPQLHYRLAPRSHI